MHDEIDGRLWIENGKHLSDEIARFARGVRTVLARLHRIDWDAPWRSNAASRARPGQA